MRSVIAMKRLAAGIVFLSATGWASQAQAQIAVGTWLRTDLQGAGMTMTMTVEVCCNGGRRFIYRIEIPNQPVTTMTVDSPMDGTDVPALVGGKPSGTMAIKRLDDRHYSAILKMSGQPSGTAQGTISADGKTLTVESVMQIGSGPGAKAIETWVRK